ncbi:MAG: CRISPR-associated protein Cas4 [Candidatus Lokiarchaeota archaeon]|nr:CRISPR-associated protein Cas4 [Candidatus Lokiarchaeota archaeon]
MSHYSISSLDEIYFTAEDMRQYVYCPRIIYFRHVMRIQPERTYKMERGEEIHDAIRKKNPELDGQIQKYYNIYLKDVKFGLVALLDYLEYYENEAIPVDIKTGKHVEQKISDHHLAQLIVQAILVESQLGLLVQKVKVWYLKENKEFIHEIDIEDKRKVLSHLKEMKKILIEEIIPKPVEDAAKCRDCEFWRYCLRG